MERMEFERLVSLEIDDALSPEDARKLEEFVSRDDSARSAREAMHEIHRAFQRMERPAAPAGLSGRIADRVLEAPAPMHRFPHISQWSRVAAAILLIACVSVGVSWFGGGNDRVSATDTELQEWRTQTFTQWDSAWGQQLTEAQIRIIVEIKESFRGTDPESGDLETGRVLTKLEEFGVLEQYCRRHGLPMEKATALIRRAANGR